MLSLHPRYPVLKVPAPARLSAAVAQGLIMPEGEAPLGREYRSPRFAHNWGGGFFRKAEIRPRRLPRAPTPLQEHYLERVLCEDRSSR